MARDSSQALCWTKELKEYYESGKDKNDKLGDDWSERIELIRCRATVALADGVDSPYALIGLAQKIEHFINLLSSSPDLREVDFDKTREIFKTFITKNKEKIRTYLQIFQVVPMDFISKHDLSGHLQEMPSKKRVWETIEKLDNQPDEIDWDAVVNMLIVAAHFMEEAKM